MIVHDESSWPRQLVTCLEQYRATLLAWEQRHIGQTPHIDVSASEFDTAIYAIQNSLDGVSLHGYHCTRLTEAEIKNVLANGLSPQSGEKLSKRIDTLVTNGELSPELAHRLKTKNQANDRNRAGMIWFCFYPPNKAGQSGLERFFRSWGGEALYNSHEVDPEIGPALGRIGIPCLIEADVPIGADKHSGLPTRLARIFLVNRGLETCEPMDHESYSTTHIPAKNILNVIRYPEPDFLTLTGAAAWKPPLVHTGTPLRPE